jgi:hypothetical protein
MVKKIKKKEKNCTNYQVLKTRLAKLPYFNHNNEACTLVLLRGFIPSEIQKCLEEQKISKNKTSKLARNLCKKILEKSKEKIWKTRCDSIIQWEKETGITMEQKVEGSNNNNNIIIRNSSSRNNNKDNNNNNKINSIRSTRNNNNSSNRNENIINYYVNICTENLILFNKRVELSYGDAIDH